MEPPAALRRPADRASACRGVEHALLPLIDYRDGLLNVGVNGAPADVASVRHRH
jgi:hypothetical protein